MLEISYITHHAQESKKPEVFDGEYHVRYSQRDEGIVDLHQEPNTKSLNKGI